MHLTEECPLTAFTGDLRRLHEAGHKQQQYGLHNLCYPPLCWHLFFCPLLILAKDRNVDQVNFYLSNKPSFCISEYFIVSGSFSTFVFVRSVVSLLSISPFFSKLYVSIYILILTSVLSLSGSHYTRSFANNISN